MTRAATILLLILLGACSGQRGSVHESGLQRRVHRPGWHLDLGLRRESVQREPMASVQRLGERPPPPFAAPLPEPALRQQPWHALPAMQPVEVAMVSAPRPAEALPAYLPSTTADQDPDDLMPKKRWNALAVPAFAAGLGTIALGFGTNLLALVGAIALTLLLAGLSIRRIRRKEQAGKGFAFAALMTGVLAALLTAMSIGRYGTDF
ncbi:MAG: DUF4190 domain-containing protein [Flavobacteriales bacterium]|nr:MAG: DUF4190 domain-containing protein [Flavobacteriales bacterium]